MSGIKPIELTQFYSRIEARGITVLKLCEICGRSRPTVTRMLNGSRRRGPVWKKIEAALMPEELALLDVALCSPWNSARVAKRPVWNAAKIAGSRSNFHPNLDGPSEPVGLSMHS